MKISNISRILRYLLAVAVLSIGFYALILLNRNKTVTVVIERGAVHGERPPLAVEKWTKTGTQTSQTKGILDPSKPACNYEDLSRFAASDASPTSPIPKIVHWIYKATDVPTQYVDVVRNCQKLNPDHAFIFWTDESALAFIKAKFPDYHYLFMNHFHDPLEFSDALRYFVVLYYGGIYLDMDVECRRPFTTAMTDYRCVVDREREVQTRVFWNSAFSAMNSVMACQRNHPFFQRSLDKLKQSVIHEKGVLARTGPVFLTKHFLEYDKSPIGRQRPVVVAPATVFSPLMDVNHLPLFRGICQSADAKVGYRKDACEEFKRNGYSHGNVAELTKNSITIHRYMHLGWGGWKHRITSLQSMCTVVRINIFRS